ncbi:type II secretion system protein GspJ, partial [Vibrio splendidus]
MWSIKSVWSTKSMSENKRTPRKQGLSS